MFQISEVLKTVPFFRTLGKDGIEFIVERLKFKPFDAEERICEIGDPGDRLYIIISGRVRVVVYPEGSKKETVIAYLGGGDYFGEMSLLTGEPRSATVITTEPSEMFILNKTDFDVIMERFPSITLSMGKIMSQRLRDTLQKAAQKGTDRIPSSVKGSLADRNLVDVLKFCEANSLNGRLVLTNGDQKGEVHYRKGELQKVELGSLHDDEAMDAMLNWKSGNFSIEPEPLKMEKDGAEMSGSAAEPVQLVIINTSLVVQKMLQHTFEKIGYTVYTVENKEKGLNLIKKLKPDVVVADIKLPDSDGLELVTAIRDISSLPVVLLTEERNYDEYSGKLAGIASVGLTKSHEVGEILHAVQQLAGR